MAYQYDTQSEVRSMFIGVLLERDLAWEVPRPTIAVLTQSAEARSSMAQGQHASGAWPRR